MLPWFPTNVKLLRCAIYDDNRLIGPQRTNGERRLLSVPSSGRALLVPQSALVATSVRLPPSLSLRWLLGCCFRGPQRHPGDLWRRLQHRLISSDERDAVAARSFRRIERAVGSFEQ